VRLLIDTHVLLWWLDGDRRIPRTVRGLIADAANEVLVSAASVWEITTKARLGKLPGAVEVARDVPACIAAQGMTGLAIEPRHAQLAGDFADPHRDPFDRMLAAQAQLEGLPLVSADEVFERFAVRRIW